MLFPVGTKHLLRLCAVVNIAVLLILCFQMFNYKKISEIDLTEADGVAQDYIQGTNSLSYRNFTATELEARLKSFIQCQERTFEPATEQRGDYTIHKNFVKAEHGQLGCLETLTYTTHADFTFLDNLVPMLERWEAPVSLSIHAPGSDYQRAIDSIRYLRDCHPKNGLVKQYVTYHIYYSNQHMPPNIYNTDKTVSHPFNCSINPPYLNYDPVELYKTQNKLLYPVNVGRNVARDAAMTHYIFPCDIELYPTPGLSRKFLEMIAANDIAFERSHPKVYPLTLFEVAESETVPVNKTVLKTMFKSGKAIAFHKFVCPECHNVPQFSQWLAKNETQGLGIFDIGKRHGRFLRWEPIFIGTHADPHYDDRLSWDGEREKMTQAYALCALDYEFHILDNAFLVHRPGIKHYEKDAEREKKVHLTNELIDKIIYPELKRQYGDRKDCTV